MKEIKFGWVTTSIASDSNTQNSLFIDNLRFIERIRGKFDSIWVEDHFQWGNQLNLECWTMLTYLAAQYPEFLFGTLVLGQLYRNPALTAKMMATLDYLTRGRYIAGIGAGWKEDEILAYGWPFPDNQTRIKQLEEAVQIIIALWKHSPATFSGYFYSIHEAYCEPRPVHPPPLLIGGSGEKLTLRIVAKYADWMNLSMFDLNMSKRKLESLLKHCEAIGRKYSTIRKTYFGIISFDDHKKEIQDKGKPHIIKGRPDEIVDELRQFIAIGIDYFILRFIDFLKLEGLEQFLYDVMPNLI